MGQRQKVNAKMRSILVDWLVEIHYKSKLQRAVLWLAVNVMDRYLESVEVERQKLQCVGVTALLIASKFEEVFPAQIKDCVFFTDNAFTPREILEMEVSILQELRYEVCVPTGYHFIKQLTFALNFTPMEMALAGYFAERALQEHEMLDHRPNFLAAAACYLARRTVQMIMSPLLQHRKRMSGCLDTESDVTKFFPLEYDQRRTILPARPEIKPEEIVYQPSSHGANMATFLTAIEFCPELYRVCTTLCSPYTCLPACLIACLTPLSLCLSPTSLLFSSEK